MKEQRDEQRTQKEAADLGRCFAIWVGLNVLVHKSRVYQTIEV